jgi:hypothetical protein
MKIPIKLQYYTLSCICDVYAAFSEYYAAKPVEIQFSKEYRAAADVIRILVGKFKKKLINREDVKKPFKIQLDYYEAYFLCQFIFANITFINGQLEQTLLHQLASKIHEQL